MENTISKKDFTKQAIFNIKFDLETYSKSLETASKRDLVIRLYEQLDKIEGYFKNEQDKRFLFLSDCYDPNPFESGEDKLKRLIKVRLAHLPEEF